MAADNIVASEVGNIVATSLFWGSTMVLGASIIGSGLYLKNRNSHDNDNTSNKPEDTKSSLTPVSPQTKEQTNGINDKIPEKDLSETITESEKPTPPEPIIPAKEEKEHVNTGRQTEILPEKPLAPTLNPTINPIALVNQAEAAKTLTLSGSVGNVEGLKDITANLQINGKDYPLEVGDNGQWSVQVPGTELAFAQGEQQATLTVSAKDNAGNPTSQTATQTYQVDTIAPTLTPTINQIALVNQAATETMQTLSGSVGNVEGLKDITANLQINGKNYPLEVGDNGQWSVQVPGTELAFAQGEQQATLTVSAKDSAGNPTSQTATQTYQVDTVAPTLNPTINPIALVNQAATEKMQTLSGTIGKTEGLQNINATLQINSKNYPLEVGDNGQWSVQVPGTELAFAQGEQQATLTVSAKDNAGNPTTQSVSETYQVDTTAPTLNPTINPIALLNQAEAAKTLTLSGSVGNVDGLKEITANLQINSKNYPLEVGDNGQWSVQVPGTELAFAQGEQQATLTVSAKDNAGNPATQSVSETYRVDTELATPKITIHNITEDNYLTLEESTQTIQLSGTVDYTDDVDPATVTVVLNINGEMINANVDGKNWTVSVAGEKLNAETAENQISATIRVQDNAKNTAENQASHTYEIEQPFDVEIRAIGENNALIAPTKMSRISGTVEFDGLYGQFYNSHAVGQLKINIGDKSYTTGFRKGDNSFFIDIPTDELAALNGQSITLDFSEGNKNESVYYLDQSKSNNHVYTMRSLRPLDSGLTAEQKSKLIPQIKTMTLSGENVKVQGSGFIVEAETEMTSISGIGTGSAKAGDTVTIVISDKTYSTQLNEEKAFDLNIPTSELRTQNGYAIKAVLTNQKGTSTADIAHYTIAVPVGAQFVNPHTALDPTNKKMDHTQPDYNMPYFISANNGLSQQGFLTGNQIGAQKPFVLRYYLLDEKDPIPLKERDQIFSLDDYLKETTQWAYERYAEIANIDLRKVDFDTFNAYNSPNLDRGGTMVFKTYLSPRAAAVATTGKHLEWSMKTGNISYNKFAAVHEIGHTFDLAHSHWGELKNENYKTENTTEFTSMSYTVDDFIVNLSNILRPYDLATTHYLFGVNQQVRSGNDVYSFKDYNPYSVGGELYIWDGGGVDTFDASNEKEGVNVNLTPGSWIYRGDTLEKHLFVKSINEISKFDFFGKDPATDTLANNWQQTAKEKYAIKEYTKGQAFIGYGTQIENLVGSAFDDKLTGNNADNNILGGEGNDIIKGGLGNDYLDGGKGADEMYGGEGDDIYIVDDVNDKVIELANQGNDTIISTIDYTLGENVENLTLIGFTAKKATGNELDNRLIANNIGNQLNGGDGNDILIGGSGEDTLIGGAGNDIFVFNSHLNGKIDHLPDFNPSEDKIRLNKEIFTLLELDRSNFDEHIRYDASTGKLSYRKAPANDKTEIVFAQLPTGLTLNKDAFIVAYPEIPTPSINMMEVNYDNLLSKQEIATDVELNGYLRFAPHLANHIKVNVNINGVEHTATVDTQNLTWKLTVPGETIRGSSDGEKTITATVIATDNYGNTAESSATQTVRVDTEFTTSPEITVNDLFADNTLHNADLSKKVSLSGTLSNIEEAASDSLRILVEINDNTAFYANKIDVDKKVWQLDLPGYLFTTNNAQNTLKITLRGEDEAGNPFADKVITHTYQLDSTAQANLFTAKGQAATISGTDGMDIFVLKPMINYNADFAANRVNEKADKIENFTLGTDKVLLPDITGTSGMLGKTSFFNGLKTDFSNFDRLVHYDKESGRLSYGENGKAVHIATFQPGLKIDQNQFLIV
ncbi:hypothetical protein RO21_01285 [[Actinobacillus] muris]|uniref:Ig-like domain-containing protein n=1 Tax=Muribacter muris TaxID=67855 RepID=A0A0J5S677_9PAST|nr:Ig-like domain-containing protein [Muribacter muris]KMK52367.1 hypothetical protein RO21_01285 [[Actinobacillus] muris] [Muribacter muris]